MDNNKELIKKKISGYETRFNDALNGKEDGQYGGNDDVNGVMWLLR